MINYCVAYDSLFSSSSFVGFSLPVYTQELEEHHYIDVCSNQAVFCCSSTTPNTCPTAIAPGNTITVTGVNFNVSCATGNTVSGSLDLVVTCVCRGATITRLFVQPNIYAFSQPNAIAFMPTSNVFNNCNIIDSQREVLSGCLNGFNLSSDISQTSTPRFNLRFSQFIGALLVSSSSAPVHYPTTGGYSYFYDTPAVSFSTSQSYDCLSKYYVNGSFTGTSVAYGSSITAPTNSSYVSHCNYLIGITYNPFGTLFTFKQLINCLPGILYSSVCTSNVSGYYINKVSGNVPPSIHYNTSSPSHNRSALTIHNYYTYYSSSTLDIDLSNIDVQLLSCNPSATATYDFIIGNVYRRFVYEDVCLNYDCYYPISLPDKTLTVRLPFSIWSKKVINESNYLPKLRFIDVFARSWNNQQMYLRLVVNNMCSNARLLAPVNSLAFNVCNLPLSFNNNCYCADRRWFAGKLVLCKTSSGVSAIYHFYTNWNLTANHCCVCYTVGSIPAHRRYISTSEVTTTVSERNRNVSLSASSTNRCNLDVLPDGTFCISKCSWCVPGTGSGTTTVNSLNNTIDIRVTTYTDGNARYQEVVGVNCLLYAHRICVNCWSDFRVVASPCTMTTLTYNDMCSLVPHEQLSLVPGTCYYKTEVAPCMSVIHGQKRDYIALNCCFVMPSAYLCLGVGGTSCVLPLTNNTNNMFWTPNPAFNQINVASGSSINLGGDIFLCNISTTLLGETGKALVLGTGSGGTVELRSDIFADKVIVRDNTCVQMNGYRLYANCLVIGNNVSFAPVFSPPITNQNYFTAAHRKDSYFGIGLYYVASHTFCFSCSVLGSGSSTGTSWGGAISFANSCYTQSGSIFTFSCYAHVSLGGIDLHRLCMHNNFPIGEPAFGNKINFPRAVGTINMAFLQEPKVYLEGVGFTSRFLFICPAEPTFVYSYNTVFTSSVDVSANWIMYRFVPSPVYINARNIRATGNWYIYGILDCFVQNCLVVTNCNSGLCGDYAFALCGAIRNFILPTPVLFLITNSLVGNLPTICRSDILSSHTYCLICFVRIMSTSVGPNLHTCFFNNPSCYPNLCYSVMPSCLMFFVKV